MLKIDSVTKVFNAGTVNEKVALSGLSLHLKEGEFVTVIGGNGAGKSTMLNAIAGVWEIAEWAYAEIDGGDAGQAFLGSQGDIWDAQKDMLLDTLGAALAALIFYVQQRRSAHMR